MHEAIATIIPMQDLPTVLPEAMKYFERTLQEYSWERWTPESIVWGLQENRLQLWAANKGEDFLYVLTEVVPEHRGPFVHIVLGGGSLDSEDEMIAQIGLIEQWARNIGAIGTVVWGRLAWGRKLAPHGFYLETSVFRHLFTERLM